MADDNEVLIKVEVDQTGSLAELQKTESAITDIEQAQEQLNAAYLNGNVTLKEYQTSRKALDNQLNSAKTTHKNLTDSLTANNKKLGEGATQSKTLGKNVLDLGANVKDTKKSTDAFGGSLETFKNGLDQFGVGASGAISQVQGLTKASLQFLATPVGAIIGVIVLALGTLASYFKNTGDGADQFAKIMAQVGAAVDVVTDRISNVGRGLMSLFTGDFDKAAEQLAGAFRGISDEMANEVTKAGEVAEAIDALEDAERAYQVRASETRNEIKLLEIQAKDRTKTEGERAALLQQAMDKEKQLSNELTEIRKGQLQATVDEVAARANLQQRSDETLEQFANRLMANEKITDDLRDKVADGIKALNDAEGESLAYQEKLQTKQNELYDKRAERQQKALDEELKALKKQADDSRDVIQKEYDEREKIANESHVKLKAMEERSFVDQAEFAKHLTEVYKAEDDKRTTLKEIGAEARKILESDEAEEFKQISLGLLDFAESIINQQIALNEARAKQQIDTVKLQTQAEQLILQAGYDDDLEALEKRFEDGIISKEEYDTQRKQLDEDYKAQEKYLEDKAEYDIDQIKRKAFESNKKMHIASAKLQVLEGAVAAFKSFAVIPVIGVGLGLAAAAAAVAYGNEQIKIMESQQYVGSGAAPPTPPGIGGLPDVTSPDITGGGGGDIGGDIDGGSVLRELAGDLDFKNQPNIIVVASWTEFTELDQQILFKEKIAER